jgi:hypothetical protein
VSSSHRYSRIVPGPGKRPTQVDAASAFFSDTGCWARMSRIDRRPGDTEKSVARRVIMKTVAPYYFIRAFTGSLTFSYFSISTFST